jgi:hypothetical protein
MVVRVRPGARRERFRLGIIVTLLSSAGCAPVPDRASHTVAEYQQDAQLRREEFTRCEADPGTLGSSADCVNVRAAERSADVGNLRNLPPLQLPQGKK